jgi:hypothetical protein
MEYMMPYIFIDPGKHTGCVVHDDAETVSISGSAISIESFLVARYGLIGVNDISFLGGAMPGANVVSLFFEDARLCKFPGGRLSGQGVGSVKRDSSRWEEWCDFYGARCYKVDPRKNKYKKLAHREMCTKLKESGHDGLIGKRSNEHERDAISLFLTWKEGRLFNEY